MNNFVVTLIIICVLLLIIFVYNSYYVYSNVSINQFPSGSFLIVPLDSPYKCLSSLNGSTGFVPCDPKDSTQLYTYNSKGIILTNASKCLTSTMSGSVYDDTCDPSFLNPQQQFFYNNTNPIIQNKRSVDGSTLYCNVCMSTNKMILSNSSTSYFASIPNIAYGLISGRYIRISVSTIGCLNMQGVSVLSNPWDFFNVAFSASVTKSSPTLCTGSPWVLLDFGKEIPLTQIGIQSTSSPVSNYSMIGAIVTVSDNNNVTIYTSDPIPTNASFTVFNLPWTTPLQTIESMIPLSCDMSASLYKYEHPSVDKNVWNSYLSLGKQQGYQWYGPSCSVSSSGMLQIM